MAGKRRIYWVTPVVTREHSARIQLLSAGRSDVRVFESVDELSKNIRHERASIIVVSDCGSERDAAKRVRDLTNIPDTRGVRLILSIEKHHQNVLDLAAACNFRDMIPLNLEAQQWVKRLEYSTAAKPIRLQVPSGQITMSNISAVHIPTRLVWISKDKMRIETSLAPKVGSILKLQGELAERIGVRSVSFTVEKTERSHLRYRFSDALVGSWSVPQAYRAKSQALVEDLYGKSDARTCRVLLAARSSALRGRLFSALSSPAYEVNAILKVQAMGNEPKYFSPDVVVVEDSLCIGEMAKHFQSMIDHLPMSTPVLIVGKDDLAGDLVRRYHEHNLIVVPELPSDLLDTPLANHFIPRKGESTRQDAVPIRSADALSLLELVSAARLSRLHPTMVRVDLPHLLRQFSLTRLSSPVVGKLVGRDLWLKCNETFYNQDGSDDKFRASFDAIVVDVDRQERSKLAQALLKLVGDHLKRLAKKEESTESDPEPLARTPELGSLRPVEQAVTTTQEKIQPEIVPQYAPVARARNVAAKEATAAPAEKEWYDWFTTRQGKKTMWQMFWILVGIGFCYSVYYSVSQRDEETIRKSGQWFGDQLYKFAPEKFEE